MLVSYLIFGVVLIQSRQSYEQSVIWCNNLLLLPQHGGGAKVCLVSIIAWSLSVWLTTKWYKYRNVSRPLPEYSRRQLGKYLAGMEGFKQSPAFRHLKISHWSPLTGVQWETFRLSFHFDFVNISYYLFYWTELDNLISSCFRNILQIFIII